MQKRELYKLENSKIVREKAEMLRTLSLILDSELTHLLNLIINDTENSIIAKTAGITEPGRYAIKVRNSPSQRKEVCIMTVLYLPREKR